jgi:hypothetical protein
MALVIQPNLPVVTPAHPPKQVPIGIPTVVVRDRTSIRRLDEAWSRAAIPQPRADFNTVGPFYVEDVNAPKGEIPAASAALDAIYAREGEIASLDAYAVSYGRYLGAVRAKDATAMSRQADAMVTYSERALAAARVAAAGLADAERGFAELLSTLQREVTSRPGGWSEALPQALREWKSPADIPAEIRTQLTESDIADGDAAILCEAMREIKPEDMDRAIAELVAKTTATDMVRQALKAAQSDATWPEPPDIDALQRQRSIAHEVMGQAGYVPPADTSAPPLDPQDPENPQKTTWLPRLQLWWALPVLAIGVLAGYSVWLRARKPTGGNDGGRAS